MIPKAFFSGDSQEDLTDGISHFFGTVLELLEGKVAVIKPQIAFFEQLGWQGLRALTHICSSARARDILIILDAKRGDIGSTAQAYAEAYLGPQSAIKADALTVNPYLGIDSIQPFLSVMQQTRTGLFVLVKTSNPGSGDFQNLETPQGPLHMSVAKKLAELSLTFRGPQTGWSSLGAVVGATYPEEAVQLRAELPHVPFLVPGYGAQGASGEFAVSGFIEGPHGREGGVVNSSRGILYPPGVHVASSKEAWAIQFESNLKQTLKDLSQAVAGAPGRSV